MNQNCCCGIMHVRTGTQLLTILIALGLCAQLIVLIASISGGMHTVTIVTHSLSLIFGTIGVIGLYMALRTNNETYLIPHLMWSAFAIATLAIVCLACFILLFYSNERLAVIYDKYFTKEKEEHKKAIIMRIVFGEFAAGCILVLLIEIWLFSVVFRFFKYLKQIHRNLGAY